jgi:PAS domain S-box-containing protein
VDPGPVRIEGRDLLYSIIHDITERKNAEEKLEESETSLRAILSASPIGICRLKKRVFEWVNDAMCRMTGYSFVEFTGKTSRFLFENDTAYERASLVYNTGKLCETQHKTKDGSLIEVLLQSIDSSKLCFGVTIFPRPFEGRVPFRVEGRVRGLRVLFRLYSAVYCGGHLSLPSLK